MVVEEFLVGEIEIEIVIKMVHQVVDKVEEGDLLIDKDRVDRQEEAHNNQTIRQMEEALEGREVVEVDDIAGGRDNRTIT